MALTAALGGARTLVISTDPAPSLGDAFGRQLGAEPRQIPTRRGRLDAVEIDAPAALARWLDSRRSVLERIALRGTWLDAEDVSRLLRLSLPGIDELAALIEIARFADAGKYDFLVVDTAPTGHTLRMLGTPGTLRAFAAVFDSMQAKHRIIVEALRGSWHPDAEDAFIDEIDRDGESLAALLRDPMRTRLSWVTLPEAMAVAETAAAVSELHARGMAVSDIIVNRITPPPRQPCAWCDARRAYEAGSLNPRPAALGRARLIGVAARDSEPTGVLALASIGAEISSAAPPADETRRRAGTTPQFRSPPPSHGEPARILQPLTRLVLFGGKGGVGKTTCAAAAALAVAQQNPARRVLLLSTDPAHSLGDALGVVATAGARAIRGGPPNLLVREMDAAQAFRNARERYAAAIDQWFDRLSTGETGSVGIDAGHDRRVMHGLMELAPPGIDEITAVLDVTDAMDDVEGGGADIIVMDTAPSGHALRLLEMPALVQDWARALMSILLKYEPVAGVGDLGGVLLRMSQGLGRLRRLLVDPARTSFVVVTRAAALPRAETGRLLRRLHALGVHVPLILVNAVGRGTCDSCRRATVVEAREFGRISRVRIGPGKQRVPVGVAPAEIPPPKGTRRLRSWRSTWRVRSGAGSILP
jgi:arsenite/tail-anchored protein-transporting ATPase